MTWGDVLTGLGYLTGLLVFVLAGWRRGLAPQALVGLVGAGLGGGALGAILGQTLVTGVPGKSFFGGLLGGWAAVLLWKRRRGLRRDTGDLFALALSSGEAIGRWGCYFSGCCAGSLGGFPTQLVQSLASLVLFLWLLARFGRGAREGVLFRDYLVVEASVRFVVEFYRLGAPGLRPVQWICLAVLIASLRRSVQPGGDCGSRGEPPDHGVPALPADVA